jgi:hypothetical protein
MDHLGQDDVDEQVERSYETARRPETRSADGREFVFAGQP